MLYMLYMLNAFAADRLRREDGASAVEYGIMVALIAIVVSAGAFAIGGNLNELFNRVAECLTALPAAC